MMTVDTEGAQTAAKMLLESFGVDGGEHTARTPQRVAAAWTRLLSGYDEDPSEHLAVTFPAPADPGLVIVSGIAVRSVCAHHLLPFMGTATVAYRPAPGSRVTGLSKLSRVVNGYARRLQVQEQLGAQIAGALADRLGPTGAAALITATHECMKLRGVEEEAARTTTLSTAGFVSEADLALIRDAHQVR